MDAYARILMGELVSATGCTEPIAIALCAAKARELLGRLPEKLDVYLSGSVIKNAHSVTVPNTGGLRGINAAAAAGAAAGDASRLLQVIGSLNSADTKRLQECIRNNAIRVHHVQGEDKLYIRVAASSGADRAEAVLAGSHTRFVSLGKNGHNLPVQVEPEQEDEEDGALSVEGILAYARAVDFSACPGLMERLTRQSQDNYAIALEGLKSDYGAGVGKTLMETAPGDMFCRMRAHAAAASDARMAGCPMPVTINSGSGNQGLTVSLPLIVFALERGLTQEQLNRGLLLSNLLAIHVKRLTGKLSAFCGVVSAAAAAGAGLAFLMGMEDDAIALVLENTLLTAGGMLCDGAKASCATKIASALESAFLALRLTQSSRRLPPCQGLAGSNAEETIRNITTVAGEGMKGTDEVILRTMLAQEN